MTADAVYAPMTTEQDLERWKGKLKGKIVLRDADARGEGVVRAARHALHRRRAEEARRRSIPPARPRRLRPVARSPSAASACSSSRRGRAGRVRAEPQGDGGTFFVQQGGAYNAERPQSFIRYPGNAPPQVVLAVEHYDRIARTLDKNVPVIDRAERQEHVRTPNQTAFNVDRGDARHRQGRRGRDARRALRLAGTAARARPTTRAGSAVMMEAMRILKASGVKLRRTVRLALWSGEEQGLLGSRAYVKEHFADRETMQLKPEHAQALRLLQRRQRHRRDPRRLPAGQRGGRADLPGRGWSRSRTSA